MLREALAQTSKNLRVRDEIKEGKDINEILPESVEDDVELQLDSRWWLEKFFNKHNLSFMRGVFLAYLFVEIPRFLMLPLIVGRAQESYVTSFISGFLGDTWIPLSLVLINCVYKSLVKLKASINKTLRRNEFVVPPILISENELAYPKLLAELDKEYQNRYIKPVMFRTLQYGLDLSFNRNYQLGSGLIATSLFLLSISLRFVFNVLPESFYAIWESGIPEITVLNTAYSFFMNSFTWLIVGMLTWTLFVTFLSSLQASGNVLKMRPFESIKEYLAPNTILVLRTSFTVTFFVAWLSPFIFFMSFLPPDPLIRQNARLLVVCVLVILIPVIVLSFLLPILEIHKCMAETRKRMLLLKKYQLEDIKKLRETSLDMYLKIQEHLIRDYKDIQASPVWVLNVYQMLELMGTILLPIITFLISVRV